MRRLMSRSDEEIENEIDLRVSYRRGWPVLQVLPLGTIPLKDPSTYLPDYDEHLQHIRNILEGQRVRALSIQVVYRVHYETSKWDDDAVTLFIPAESGIGNWYMAVRDIRKYLSKKAIDIAIEIIDPRAQRISTFAILPSDIHAIELWNGRLRDNVVNILELCGLQWISVNVFHRGLEDSREKCKQTVLISAADASDKEWWDRVLPRLRQICSPHFLVELTYQDQLIFTPNEEAIHAARRLSSKSFGFSIDMGASCGPAGTDASGSMGGMVRLRQGDQDIGTFGISNHHVVLTDVLQHGKIDHCAVLFVAFSKRLADKAI
jgi:hypothetical protein